MKIPHSNPRRGFTLLELLAATAVLCLILSVLFQTSRQVLRATRSSHGQMEAARCSRAVLDTLGADLASRVGSANETLFAAPKSKDSELLFFNRSRGPSSSNDFRYLVVDYQLSGNQIIRKTGVVAWSGTDQNYIALNTATSSSAASDILATGILRFEAVAVLNDGTLKPLPSTVSTGTDAWTAGTWQGKSLTNGLQALLLAGPRESQGSKRVRALIVAVAAMDSQSLEVLSGLNIDVAGKLPAASADQTPIDAWNAAIARGDLSSVPSTILSALQFSQQIYPLDTP